MRMQKSYPKTKRTRIVSVRIPLDLVDRLERLPSKSAAIIAALTMYLDKMIEEGGRTTKKSG